MFRLIDRIVANLPPGQATSAASSHSLLRSHQTNQAGSNKLFGRQIKLAALCVSGLLLSSGPLPAENKPFALQILHASDLEGGVDALDDAPAFAAVVEGLRRDGAERGWPSLLLSSGDNYIPGPFFDAASDPSVSAALSAAAKQDGLVAARGRIDIAIMNAVGFDASALGNHDLDAGPKGLAKAIAVERGDGQSLRWTGATFPYLSANIDFSAEPALAALFTTQLLDWSDTSDASPDQQSPASMAIAPAAMVERDGERIALIGLTTPMLEELTSVGGVRVAGQSTNDMQALAALVQPTIDAIVAAGINKIIVLSHLQSLELEEQLAPLLSGVDVIVAGGSEAFLSNEGWRVRDTDSELVGRRPYPLVSQGADGHPVLIVSAAGQYRYLGRLVVSFDANGVVTTDALDSEVNGPYPTDESMVESLWGTLDAAYIAGTAGQVVADLTNAVRDVVIGKDRKIFGRTTVYLEGRRAKVRTEETNFGNLSADANLTYARIADPSVQVSIKNGGGIRDSIGFVNTQTGPEPPVENAYTGKRAGEISQLDIENALKFNNGLSLLTLTAAELKTVIEHGLSRSAEVKTPGRFPQVAGIAVAFDTRQPAGSRIRDLAIKDGQGFTADIIVADGEMAGDPERQIRVVTLDFLADGGDGYPFKQIAADAAERVNRVDLRTAEQEAKPGLAEFSDWGTEQDALASFLAGNYAQVPFDKPETAPGVDARLQNLAARSGTAIAPNPRARGSDFGLRLAATPIARMPISSAETIAYDSASMRAAVSQSSANQVTVVDLSDPTSPRRVGRIDLEALFADRRTAISVTSVATHRGLIAVTVARKRVLDSKHRRGVVAFFDMAGRYLGEQAVGYGPDMAQFSHGGSLLLVANEGEPNDDYSQDPRGSISIIEVPTGPRCTMACETIAPVNFDVLESMHVELDFSAFDSQKYRLREQGLRVFGPGASIATDMEPEFITISGDDKTAWVTLQENNALAIIDLTTKAIQSIIPLGLKWWPAHGGFDASDSDQRINLQPWPVAALYQPDAIAAMRVGPDTYLLTANEGDARTYAAFNEEARVAELKLDSEAFPQAQALLAPQALGRLKVSTVGADPDDDGDIDQLLAFGARSFSVWRTQKDGSVSLVYDSGHELELLGASTNPEMFNANNEGADSFDQRSDDKGPEPEGLVVGDAFDRKLAFVGLERHGAVAIFDVTDPAQSYMAGVAATRNSLDQSSVYVGDSGPEGLAFVPSSHSPTRSPLLLVAYEASETVTIYELSQQ